MGVSEQYLKEVAATTDFTYDELNQTADDLENAIQDRFHKHFKRSRLQTGPNYWLIEDPDGVWFAFNQFEIEEELREAGVEYDPSKVYAVARANLIELQNVWDSTIAVPGTIARSFEDPFFFAIHVEYPDGWEGGEWHTFQRFKELVWRFEMTPAEALDYWVVETMNQSPDEWAGKRSVRAESIRKNVRQAREKLADDDLGATHANSDLHTVPLDDVPADEPRDPDKDLFYVPKIDSGETST